MVHLPASQNTLCVHDVGVYVCHFKVIKCPSPPHYSTVAEVVVAEQLTPNCTVSILHLDAHYTCSPHSHFTCVKASLVCVSP